MTRLGLRILQVVTSPQRRGAETFAVDLDRALAAEGARVRTVALSPAVTGAELPVEVLGPSRWSPRTLRSLRRAAREADVVIAHGSATLVASALATACTGTPFVYRLIGDPAYWSASLTRRARVGVLLRRARAVTVYFDDAAAALRRRFRLASSRICIIPKGVPLADYPAPTDDDREQARRSIGLPLDGAWVAFVGALTPEKRPGLAIDAVARLADVGLVLAGEGHMRSELESRHALAADRVRFLGAVADPREVYLACDAVVLTSRTEGVPGALIEAGLCARPAVATNVGGVTQVVDHGVTGFVVDEDSPEAIATGLASAIERSHELGAAARSHVRAHFDIVPVAQRWLDLLEVLAAPRGDLRTAPRHPG